MQVESRQEEPSIRPRPESERAVGLIREYSKRATFMLIVTMHIESCILRFRYLYAFLLSIKDY